MCIQGENNRDTEAWFDAFTKAMEVSMLNSAIYKVTVNKTFIKCSNHLSAKRHWFSHTRLFKADRKLCFVESLKFFYK